MKGKLGSVQIWGEQNNQAGEFFCLFFFLSFFLGHWARARLFFLFFPDQHATGGGDWGRRWPWDSCGIHLNTAPSVCVIQMSLFKLLQNNLLKGGLAALLFLHGFIFCSKFPRALQQPMKRNNASYAQLMPPRSHPYSHNMPVWLWNLCYCQTPTDCTPREEEDSDGKSCSTLNPWRHGT